MAALLNTLSNLMTLVVYASLALGPVYGGLKVLKASKEEARQEQVRQLAARRGMQTGPRTYRL